MNDSPKAYGLLAEFGEAEELLKAARRATEEGYRDVDAFSPFPVEGLAEALGRGRTAVALIVLIGGILGGLGALFMMWWACVISYPLNVGGRPLNSWPAFIPITFELTVLSASLFGLVGMLALNGLPEPYHPLFNDPRFTQATRDRFFLCIMATDEKYDREKTRRFLERLGASSVAEVES